MSAYRDLLVAALSYPDPTPDTALEAAAALARRIGGEVTLLATEADLPEFHNLLANALVGLDEMAREQEAASATRAAEQGRRFLAAAAKHGVAAKVLLERASLEKEAERIAAHARTRDLALLPLGPAVLNDVALVQSVLFGSGRPVLVFPEGLSLPVRDRFERAAIAWDGGRPAARAIADALPLLERADEVRVLVVTGEKPAARHGAAKDLVRHLATHGLAAVVDEFEAAGEPIGAVLRRYVSAQRPDLLVMGGYGHSRAREFVLGGATASILEAPPCPVLLSH
jgi:nucleotide-binding universal stress UspA family protein